MAPDEIDVAWTAPQAGGDRLPCPRRARGSLRRDLRAFDPRLSCGRREGAGIHAMPQAHWQRLTDLATRLSDMDAMGVDIQVISPNILHNAPTRSTPRKPCGSSVRQRSHRRNGRGEARPARRARLGAVAVARAASEMERATGALGLKGVIVASRVNGMELGDDSLRPFWSAPRRSACRSSSTGRQPRPAARAGTDADLARPAAGGGLCAVLADL